MLAEVRIAIPHGKLIHQIVPHGGGSPNAVLNAGPVIRWEWEKVKRIISTPPR